MKLCSFDARSKGQPNLLVEGKRRRKSREGPTTSSDGVPVALGMQRASWQRRQDLPRGRDEPRLTFMAGHGAFVFMGKAIGKARGYEEEDFAPLPLASSLVSISL